MVWNRVRWFKLFSQAFILKPILSHFFIPIRDFSNFGCKVTTIRYKHISILKHNIVDFVTLLYRIFSILFHNMQKALFFPNSSVFIRKCQWNWFLLKQTRFQKNSIKNGVNSSKSYTLAETFFYLSRRKNGNKGNDWFQQ